MHFSLTLFSLVTSFRQLHPNCQTFTHLRTIATKKASFMTLNLTFSANIDKIWNVCELSQG